MTAHPCLSPCLLGNLSAGLLPFAQRLCDRIDHLLHREATASRAVHRSSVDLDVEAEPPGACGWFDSSHELVHGLQVQELNSPESLAAALPLAAWLQLQLEGSGSAQPA